ACAGADVVGAAGAFAEIEVRRDRRQSMMGELAGRLLDPFIPPRHVMDQHHAGPRPAAERPCVIGFAHIALVAAEGDRLREHTFIGHGVPRRFECRAAGTIIHTVARTGGPKVAEQRLGLWERPLGLWERREGEPLSRDIDEARPCRSGPDPKSRWSCPRAA